MYRVTPSYDLKALILADLALFFLLQENTDESTRKKEREGEEGGKERERDVRSSADSTKDSRRVSSNSMVTR